jgi:hypothetical protein
MNIYIAPEILKATATNCKISATTAANRKISKTKTTPARHPPYTPSNTPNHAHHDFIHSSVIDTYTPSKFPKPTSADHKYPLTLLTFHTFTSSNLISFTMSTQHPLPSKLPISSFPLPAESNRLTTFDCYKGLPLIPKTIFSESLQYTMMAQVNIPPKPNGHTAPTKQDCCTFIKDSGITHYIGHHLHKLPCYFEATHIDNSIKSATSNSKLNPSTHFYYPVTLQPYSNDDQISNYEDCTNVCPAMKTPV